MPHQDGLGKYYQLGNIGMNLSMIILNKDKINTETNRWVKFKKLKEKFNRQLLVNLWGIQTLMPLEGRMMNENVDPLHSYVGYID